ncbi:MAG: TonB-dependent receptor [Terriglobales bacterium]|jgi:hypothetical protein
MPFRRYLKSTFALFLLCLAFLTPSDAQTELAHVHGRVTDQSGAVVVDTEVEIKNVDTNLSTPVKTNQDGIYTFPSLRPGRYVLSARKAGFKTVTVTEFILNAQDQVTRDFVLQVGSGSESVTVTAETLNVNTTDATVSTVVDRQFAENLPLNGRSFQTLIELTPGVVLTAASPNDTGQFSVNGQRASSNYWTVDGVSANVGTGGVGSSTNNPPGNGFGGAVGATTILGGTNSLVSVDAMQEFRIDTSTFAPDTGRTPGGQISIVTRSGTNEFHGALFDYLRNTVLDANDWFNGYTNNPPLPKAGEHQNDFGGTLGGPILKDRTFFFFSYEGLRLRLPETTLTQVPDLQARQNAIPAMQPFLNAFPFDPNQPDLGGGVAQFNASYSNPSSLDAYSLRIDHKLTDKLTLFGRYNYSPSSLTARALGGGTLNSVTPAQQTLQTGTLGATWILSPTISDDFRFNYSRVNIVTSSKLDDFGGAVPVTPPFPSPFTTQDAVFGFDIYTLTNADFSSGAGTHSVQRQLALVDNVAVQRGTHRLAFGVDFRRLSPQLDQAQYFLLPFFSGIPTAEAGNPDGGTFVYSSVGANLLFRNLSLFAQDTWQAAPRLTLTYGLRWDVDFAPAALSGPGLPAVVNYNNLSQLALAPPGTPPFSTRYGNVAPRIGVAYQLSQKNGTPVTVLRAGFGVYHDLATSEVGNNLNQGYPYSAYNFIFGGTFPASPAPPQIEAPNAANGGTLVGFDPHLRLPYTLEWNVAVQQDLGNQQTLSVSYVGAAGNSLLQSADVVSPNQNFAQAILVGNTGTSDYNALQIQFQRRLSHGLQALASYSWSHSIDTGSSGSLNGPSSLPGPGINPNQNRGPSDFDIRQAFSAAVTYDVPVPKLDRLTRTILGGWSLQNIVQVHSASPVDVDDGLFSMILNRAADVRPDLVPGIPLYLYGSQYPGGKILNNTPNQGGPGCIGPFCPPPTDSNGNPLRQGDLGRNAVRGFGLMQWDFAVHRDFPIHESLKLQFRAEMFNVLNHPNFGPPLGDISNGSFGYSAETLGQYLGGGGNGYGLASGLSPLYQIGGPRSIQLALKLLF